MSEGVLPLKYPKLIPPSTLSPDIWMSCEFPSQTIPILTHTLPVKVAELWEAIPAAVSSAIWRAFETYLKVWKGTTVCSELGNWAWRFTFETMYFEKNWGWKKWYLSINKQYIPNQSLVERATLLRSSMESPLSNQSSNFFASAQLEPLIVSLPKKQKWTTKLSSHSSSLAYILLC